MRFLIVVVYIFTFIGVSHAQRDDFNEVDFWRAEYIAQGYKGEELQQMYEITHGIKSQLTTEVERFRAVYYWVCHNIRGDYYLTTENDDERRRLRDDPEALQRWNNQFKKEVFAKLLMEKKTLCTGYAYLIKELANRVGLECEMIYGFGQTNKTKLDDLDAPNHTWNAVKLNGKWYLCDATWSSGVIDMATYSFKFKYDDSFFLMDPAKFAETHQPIEAKWSLLNQEVP
ncbi:transglutaminase domain-containing protein [Aureisphaera galaxeae]|uniref:transglutaminase domain-containing protein n=1 Tax=Aureisphaera galaxeae TaxID=1538023 RepID=UPI002350E691|nr:transglutaminase domain-containing protein [Aureisphaera galaxeae]MDC8003937.1 transglutaminase domain-containing protein [Aureisphaera galaxeae]